MKKNDKDVAVSEAFLEPLACQLTTEELAAAANKLAGLLKEREALAQKKKDAVAKFSGEISELDAIIKGMEQVINDGEVRAVSCEWHYSWEKKKKRLIRLDTSEEVRNASITDEDKQLRIWME